MELARGGGGGIGDFFGKLFQNIGKFARKPMMDAGRTGFNIQRPNPYMSDAPEDGNWSQSSIPSQSDGTDQYVGLLDALKQLPQQGGGANMTRDAPVDTTDATYTPGDTTYNAGPAPSDLLFKDIQDIQGRRYNKDKNPDFDPNQPVGPDNQKYIYGKDYDKTHNWKDVLRGVGLGMLKGGAGVDPRQGGYAILGGMLGGAGGGGIAAGIDRNADNKMIDQLKLGQLTPQYEQAYGMEQQRKQDALRQKKGEVDIENTKEDNRRLAQIAQNQEEERVSRRKQTQRDSWFKSHKFFDPSKATEADKRALAEFDETPDSIGKYDMTNPKLQTVAGVQYKYNPNTGALEETGLKDTSKGIVEYEVTDPATGVTSKYATTSARAAALKTSLVAAGMQIKAASQRQESQQKFTTERDAKRNQLATQLQKEMADYKAGIDAQASEQDQTRKLALVKANEERQANIARLQKELKDQLLLPDEPQQ